MAVQTATTLNGTGGLARQVTVATAAATAGDILALLNPEARTLYIKRVLVHVYGASDAAATADVGISADATTLNDTLIDGLNLNSAGLYDNIKDKGTNGLERKLWLAGEYLTISKASGAANAEIGTDLRIIVEYDSVGY